MRLLLGVLVILYLITSCKKQPTTWEQELVSPIANDTIDLSNFYNDSTLVSVIPGSLNLDLTRTILNIGINDVVTIPDTTISQVFSPTLNINNVQSGSQFVNSIEEHPLALGDVILKKAILSSGRIDLKVFNPLNTGVIFTIEMPGVKQGGVNLIHEFSVPAGSIASPSFAETSFDISNYELDLTAQSGLNYNKLQSRLSIKTDPNGPVTNVTTNHDFTFQAKLTNLKLSYAKGYFGSATISDTSQFTVPYLSNIVSGNIDIPSSDIQFKIENGMKLAMRAALTYAKNTNSQGNSVFLSSSLMNNPILLNAALGSWNNITPSSSILNFTPSNSNMEQFVENLGGNQELGYQLQLNPWGNISGSTDEIFPNSRIKLKVSTQMPMTIGSDGLTLRDTFNLSLSQNTSKSHLTSGIIKLKASNAFPYAVSPVLYLANEAGDILFTVIGDAQISSSEMGVINPQTGLKEKTSTVQFNLSEEIITQLNSIKKVIAELRVDSPDINTGANIPVSIPYGAYVSVKLSAVMQTKIVY